jgi:hypothetical protein
MGAIQEISSGRLRLLEPENLVGRGPPCTLRLGARYVSTQHALLRWRDVRWELRDLGSLNGTFLDGARVEPGREYSLRCGSIIAFGKASDAAWELTDDSAPGVMAVPLRGGDAVVLDAELLALPSAEEPIATIFRNRDGEWVLEHVHEATVRIVNGQIFQIDGKPWRFSCPDAVWPTALASASGGVEGRGIELTFRVSRDEEFVELRAACGERQVSLGSRAFNYLLLTLARRRMQDAEAGVPDDACGWVDVDDLSHDPSMAPPQLNLDVFRIRRHFTSARIGDAESIVERRVRPRQLRIGTGRIHVVRI